MEAGLRQHDKRVSGMAGPIRAIHMVAGMRYGLAAVGLYSRIRRGPGNTEARAMRKRGPWVAFTLRPEARWHDGTPITVDDVIFSLETLKTKGHPFYRAYYASVEKAEKVGDRKVKFTFKGGTNRELPLIVGQMPILSKAYWQGKDFEATTMTPPLGSGPYKIATFDAGRSVTLQRVP